MVGFVLAVSPSGVCSFRSRRSFRVLSGGAVAACCGAVRRSVRSVRRGASRGRVSAVVPAASLAGSALFLSSSAFASALSSGCPVSFLSSVFSWPVRSAVLLCLARVFLSRRGRLASLPCGVLCLLPVAVRSSFVSAAASCLGVAPSSLALSSLSLSVGVPRVPRFSGVVSLPAVVGVLSSLSRCLRWLSRRGGCPRALRPVLALVAALVARSLA